MTIDELPLDTFKKFEVLEHLKDSKYKIISVHCKDTLLLALADLGYLEIFDKDSSWSNGYYLKYILTNKFLNSNREDILKDLTGFSIEEIMKNKVIPAREIPFYDYEYFLDSIVDGEFEDIDNMCRHYPNFKEALDFHGFTNGSGGDDEFSYATDKLTSYVKMKAYYPVIRALTGKSKEENEAILFEEKKEKEIASMREIAEKYGYIVFEKKD